MDTQTLLQQLEAHVRSFKTLLEEGGESGAIGQALEDIQAMEDHLPDTPGARPGYENLRERAQAFALAMEGNDRQKAAKSLILMEEALQRLADGCTVAKEVGMPDAGGRAEGGF